MKSHGIEKVQRGISVIYYALILRILTLIISLVFSFINIGNANILLNLGMFSSSIMDLTGKSFCLSTPRETKGKTLIYISLLIDVLVQVVFLTINAINAGLIPIGEFQAKLFLAWVFSIMICMTIAKILADACFLLFLRQLAKFIHSKEILDMATSLLAALTIFIVILSLSFIIAEEIIRSAMILIVILIGILTFVQYSRLLDGLRKKLQDFT